MENYLPLLQSTSLFAGLEAEALRVLLGEVGAVLRTYSRGETLVLAGQSNRRVGVVLSGLGIWLMTSSDSVIALVQYVFGAVVIFHGVLDVQSSVSLMRQGAARWWLDLALSALTLALGALILINPFGTFAALVTLIGLVLIYDGLSDLWIIHRLSRMVRDLERDLNGDIIETRGRDLDE